MPDMSPLAGATSIHMTAAQAKGYASARILLEDAIAAIPLNELAVLIATAIKKRLPAPGEAHACAQAVERIIDGGHRA